MTMTYEQFKAHLVKMLLTEYDIKEEDFTFLPKGATSDDPKMLEIIRLANQIYEIDSDDQDILQEDCLLVRHDAGTGDRTHFMQCIAMERLYADAQDAGFEQAFSGIRKNLQGCRDAKVDTIILKCRNASAFGKIRKGLIIKPLNYALHFHDLADCVYRRVGEVTLVLCLLLGDTADVLTTSRITKEEIKAWGMEGKEQEILQEALENTAKLFPACVYDWRIKAEVDFLSSDVKKDDMRAPTGQILLSTKRVVNGAAALFYPGVVEKMMQVMGGEFVAVFLNVNDAMIFEPEDPESISFAYTAKHSLDHVEMLSTKRYLCNEDGIHTIQ